MRWREDRGEDICGTDGLFVRVLCVRSCVRAWKGRADLAVLGGVGEGAEKMSEGRRSSKEGGIVSIGQVDGTKLHSSASNLTTQRVLVPAPSPVRVCARSRTRVQ